MCNWIANQGGSREAELNWRSCTCLYPDSSLSLSLFTWPPWLISEGPGSRIQLKKRTKERWIIYVRFNVSSLQLNVTEIFFTFIVKYRIRFILLLLITNESRGWIEKIISRN